MAPEKPDQPSEILVEFVVRGNAVRATAIDSASGLEASIVGPAGAPRAALEAAAVRKLAALIKKRRGEA